MTTITDDRLLSILRAAPRSTTAQIIGYIFEDFEVHIQPKVLRQQLNRLWEAGVLGRHDRRDNYPNLQYSQYTWWVQDFPDRLKYFIQKDDAILRRLESK